MRDPRPDLREDAVHWSRLLALAGDVSRDLVMVLNGFRCLGVRLDVRDGEAAVSCLATAKTTTHFGTSGFYHTGAR